MGVVYVCVCAHTHTYIFICVCVCMRVCVCMCIRMRTSTDLVEVYASALQQLDAGKAVFQSNLEDASAFLVRHFVPVCVCVFSVYV